ncbi:integumentary mucin C.1-like [Stegodyphus dumicola]|uniref:integumentary mucin C.1-like n=1 Tax=Stegodyphus dumicola TaxID=202533 RepID=UPI0015A999A6|nr:integumentary mucin C.1-like [Stegodyphus dumicola]
MAFLQTACVLLTFLLNIFDSEGFSESKYELQIMGRIYDAGIFKTVNGTSRMQCAALCMQEEPCAGFGFISRTCSLLNTAVNEENCKTLECSDAPGIQIYVKQVDVLTTTTTTQPPSTTTTTAKPTTTSVTTEPTTTTTTTEPTTTTTTTKPTTTTTTTEPTTTTTTIELTTTTTKPTTTTTTKPTTTTTTTKPTTTTTESTTTTTTTEPTTTTTTTEPTTTTTTTEPTTTTTTTEPITTTTTTQPTTTTTTTKPTTTSTTTEPTTTITEASGEEITVIIKCVTDGLVLQGLIMTQTAFFQDAETKDVCFSLGAVKAFANSERTTFEFDGAEKAVCTGFNNPGIEGMEAEVRDGKLLKLRISCGELNDDVVDKDTKVATVSSAPENKKVVCGELYAIQSIEAKKADKFIYEVEVSCQKLKRPSSASSLG